MCVTFAVNGRKLLAQNYDFYFGHGYLVFNPFGLQKSVPSGSARRPLSWRSRYCSVTFNQFGCEFPVGGMNEKGLCAAMMFDEDGHFPDEENSSGLSELQWLQYQLDNFSTVAEVRAHLERTLPYTAIMPLHYSVADRKGRSLIVEFPDGRPVVGEYGTCHVLTNTGLKQTLAADRPKREEDITLERDISVKRFKILADMLAHADLGCTDVAQAFDWLDKVSFRNRPDQIGYRWFSQAQAPSYTFWSVVYDMEHLTVYFKTLDRPEIKTVSLEKMPDLYRGISMLDVNTTHTGEVSARFSPFDADRNRRMIEQSFRPPLPPLPSEIIELMSIYPTLFTPSSDAS